MEISTMSVSFPIDEETEQELLNLLTECESYDQLTYGQVLNQWAWTSPLAKGFVVLAYDDDEDILVGAAAAIDMIGVHAYEWSGFVGPAFRRKGIGHRIVMSVQQNLELRDAEGELALAVSGAPGGIPFLEAVGYQYEFSEATLEAMAGEKGKDKNIEFRPFTNEVAELTDLLSSAFGDSIEESEALVEFNDTDPTRSIWLAMKGEKIVGTMTIVEENEGAWLTALAVHPSETRQGIGLALLTFAQEIAARSGKQRILLDVEIENDRALSLYEKAGFTKILQVDYFKKEPLLN